MIILASRETWWNGFYDQSVEMERYSLFRKDRQGSMEFHPRMDEEVMESLLVKMKVKAGTL